MSVTVSGASGLTNAYTSVLSATGSLEISGASRCDDMNEPHCVLCESSERQMAGQAHPAARAIRAARSLSRSRVWLVPENTSMSPDLASRTCTTRAPDAFAVPPLRGDGRLVAAAAGLAAAARDVAARPAAPAVATVCSI